MTDADRPAPDLAPSDDTREVERWMYQFTAQLAHDMRAPMGAIFMWAHVLRGTDVGENKAAIEAIEASARQQSRMLADVVDMARALVGRLKIEPAPADLTAVVSAAVEEKAKDAAARRVTVDWPGRAEPGTPGAMVKADAKRLQQALACLIAYALANATAGRVTVRLAVGPGSQLEVRIGVPAGGVEATAADDLFVPYRARGLDLVAGRPDFGMGLAFARAMLRLHGGTLDVDNQGPGGELAFVARLTPDPD